MRCLMNAYDNLRLMMKTVLRSNENFSSYQRIASEIFSTLKLLLQAIARQFEHPIKNQSQVNYL